jgi:SAM-dependent methyltransferase
MTQCKICQNKSLSRQNGNFHDYISQKTFEIWQCKNCFSMQTKGEIKGNYYGQPYYGSKKGKFSKYLESIFSYNHKRTANKFYKQFKPNSVLEIGCGRGYILAELQSLGCEVFGLESNSAEEWILNNPLFPVIAIKENNVVWPIPDNSIDLVIIWHVLEHVSDPEQVLTEIKRVLSPNGTVCISVPNCESLQAKVSLPLWFHLDVPRHLFHFSRKGLKLQLENIGFYITDEKNGDILQNTYGWWQTLANLTTPKNANLLYRFLQGGLPWKSCPKRYQLAYQLLALPLIIPIGFIAMIIENTIKKPGSITIYAKKP